MNPIQKQSLLYRNPFPFVCSVCTVTSSMLGVVVLYLSALVLYIADHGEGTGVGAGTAGTGTGTGETANDESDVCDRNCNRWTTAIALGVFGGVVQLLEGFYNSIASTVPVVTCEQVTGTASRGPGDRGLVGILTHAVLFLLTISSFTLGLIHVHKRFNFDSEDRQTNSIVFIVYMISIGASVVWNFGLYACSVVGLMSGNGSKTS